MQYAPYVGATALTIGLGWFFLRRSHPELASVLPISFDRARFTEIMRKSFWVYLYCIGGTVYIITDRLVINAGFGAAQLPPYHLNFKLCELALFVIGSASFVSIPKIAVWIASADPDVRQRGGAEVARLSRFQTFLGCAAVLSYLAINDAFMRWWVGEAYRVPLSWQAAFAANMGVTAAGYAGYDLAARCGAEGLRFGAKVVAAGVLVKVAGSCLGIMQQSILLIACSSVVSQTLVVLVCGWYGYRTVGLSWWRLAGTGWFLALGCTAFATCWKAYLWEKGLGGRLGFVIVALLLLCLTATIIRLTPAELKAEWATVRSLFGTRR